MRQTTKVLELTTRPYDIIRALWPDHPWWGPDAKV